MVRIPQKEVVSHNEKKSNGLQHDSSRMLTAPRPSPMEMLKIVSIQVIFQKY